MLQEIRKELDTLEYYTEILSTATTYPEDIFMESPLIYGGAERYVLLGLERVSDVCKLLTSYYHIEGVNDYKDILRVLEEKKVYPDWLSHRLTERVEQSLYSEIDYLEGLSKDSLYVLLDETISDFRYFRKYVLEYVA